MMKNPFEFFFILLFVVAISISFVSCKKTTANKYIPECDNTSGTTQFERNENCKACCIANGWDDGAFWEVGVVGCECYKGDK